MVRAGTLSCNVCMVGFAAFAGLFFLGPRFLYAPKVSVDISSSLKGKLVLITGGSAGIGREAAKMLAIRGAEVLVTGRTFEGIRKATPLGGTGFALDLSDFVAVRRFAADINKLVGARRLDILILNAGMRYGSEYRGPYQTADGRFDMNIASNVLGHFLLLQQLRTLVERSKTRVVVTSSVVSWFSTQATFVDNNVAADGETLSPLTSIQIYSASKFQALLFAYKLQRDLKESGATVVVCTPGMVSTSLGQAMRGTDSMFLMYHIAKSAFAGGEVLQAAALMDAELAYGRILQPYWIWEEFACRAPYALRCIYLLVSEACFEHFTWGLYSFRTSPESYDARLQEEMWEWAEMATRE